MHAKRPNDAIPSHTFYEELFDETVADASQQKEVHEEHRLEFWVVAEHSLQPYRSSTSHELAASADARVSRGSESQDSPAHPEP
jgi:hypothetical protein